MIENVHGLGRGRAYETDFEVWDYRAEDGTYYGVVFDKASRVGVKLGPP